MTLHTDDGLEAINLVWASRPDLILMDIQLPYISGLEVTRRLKADDRSKQIPIIAVRSCRDVAINIARNGLVADIVSVVDAVDGAFEVQKY